MPSAQTTGALSRYAMFTASYLQNPYPVWAQMRVEQPVYRAELPSGALFWLVTRYEDVRAAYNNADLRKDAIQMHEVLEQQLSKGGQHDTFPESLAAHMLNSDPPVHTRLRKLVAKAFTSRRVMQLRPWIEKVTDELLDEMARKNEVDLITEFAFNLPITVICELLGVALNDRESFRTWSNVIAGNSTLERLGWASEKMSEYLATVIVEKRTNPSDDLLSSLMTQADDGDRLSDAEGVAMTFLLLMAGYETTVNLIGNGMEALLRRPDQWALLLADPGLVPNAVEEVLRFASPVHTATTRFTSAATTVGGVTIPEGEIVLLCQSSANWDEGRFDGAETLDVTRRNANKHVAFGHGIHHCLGAPLARLEGEIAFTKLLERFPAIRLGVDPSALRWRHGNITRGLESLPVVLA